MFNKPSLFLDWKWSNDLNRLWCRLWSPMSKSCALSAIKLANLWVIQQLNVTLAAWHGPQERMNWLGATLKQKQFLWDCLILLQTDEYHHLKEAFLVYRNLKQWVGKVCSWYSNYKQKVYNQERSCLNIGNEMGHKHWLQFYLVDLQKPPQWLDRHIRTPKCQNMSAANDTQYNTWLFLTVT